MKKILFVLFTALLFKVNAQITYMYSDGNSNAYSIKETELKYDPVSKEESSSGHYSGGEAKVIIITPHELNKLTVLFEEVMADSSCQQTKRSMGSGLLIRYNKTTAEKKVIIKFKSEQLRKVDLALNELLK
jgi:hypothetical protein